MTNDHRDLYGEFMALLVPEAEQKLGRELTPAERQALWNVKSLLRLEQLGDYLELLTHSAAEAEAWVRDVVQRYSDAGNDSPTS